MNCIEVHTIASMKKVEISYKVVHVYIGENHSLYSNFVHVVWQCMPH